MDQSSSELEQEYDLYHAYQRTTYCRKEVVESSTEKEKPISIKNDDEKGVYQNHYLRQPAPTEVQDYSPSQWHGPSCFALYECPSNVPLMLRHFIFQHWVIFVRGLDEQIPLEERCRCPMIGCQQPFDLQLHLIGHIKVCKALKEGSYWCPFCRQEETIMLPTVLSDNMMAGTKMEKWHMLDSAYLSLAKFGSKARQRVSKLLAFKVKGKRWLMISKNTSGILELEAPIERYSGSEHVLPINQGYPRPELDGGWFAELDGSNYYYGPGQAIKPPFDLPVEISGSEPSFELEHPSSVPWRLEAPNLKRKHASATEASYASPVFKDCLDTNSSPLSKRCFGDFNFGQSTGTRPTSASPTSTNIAHNTSPKWDNTGHADKSSETFDSTTTSLSTAEDPISRYQQSTTDHHRPSTSSAHLEGDKTLDLNEIERGRYIQQVIQQVTTPLLYCNTYNSVEQLNGDPSPTSTDSSTTYFSTGSDKSCSFTVSPTSTVSNERTFYKKDPLTLDTFAIDTQKPSTNAQQSRPSTSSPDQPLQFIPSSPHSDNTSPTSSIGSQSSGSVASDPGQCRLCPNRYAGKKPRDARQNLKRHMKEKHCESPKQFICPHCRTSIGRSDNYGTHIRKCKEKDD